MELSKLKKDENSKAVLNTDISGLKAYKHRRAREKEINSVLELKNDIAEIKDLLKELLNRT